MRSSTGKRTQSQPLQYTIVAGEQIDTATYDDIKQGESFEIRQTTTESNKYSIHSAVK